ncbi:AraC-like DNA-binding protein [Luteibacter sp. HA06]
MLGPSSRTVYDGYSLILDHASGLMALPAFADESDAASELLLGMRLVGVNYRRIELARPFGIGFAGEPGHAQFHFIGRGPVLLRTHDDRLLSLQTGDAVLLPQGRPHVLVSSADVASRDVTDFLATPLCNSVANIHPDCDASVQADGALIFSGCMEFELGGMQPLVTAMPEVMLVSTLLDRSPELRPMLDAMERESCNKRAGFAGILARLADVISAIIVRGWVESGCGEASGWLKGLRDPRLGKAIVAMHRDPGRNWTVAELADEMGSSRSVFAERFLAVTGMTPVRYLTELRMRLAAQWIGRDGSTIESVAFQLGYGSLAAFSRAFKRVIGEPPGAVRHASR